MAVLDSCPKHNMVAYLEKSEGNAEFHEIINFLTRSSIHHALTVSHVVSTTFVEQFWTSAKSKIINNVRHITAKVAGKYVSISKASIRSDLLFDDANGIDSLPNQAILMPIQLMGKSFSKKQRVHKEFVSKQGRKFAKGESSVQRDPLFDEIPEGTVDHIDQEICSGCGRVSTDKEKVSTDRPIVSTDGSKVSTDRQIEGTDEQNEGTEEQIESTDGQRKGTEDHTEEGIMPKQVSKKKEKGVELKDIEETDRPRPTSTRSLLTLKPLPKIDPKDKGKKKIEEEDESKSESDGIPEAEKKFKQLENDEEMARKI
ncbi:hypothetical protein Tco_0804369 [Tanacetum coccineum]|uniref:Uncharacterized protein n=1 Tax=Tanacetum coccineum TaxID=301880 RepID=A0ABQ5A740_9ASTR